MVSTSQPDGASVDEVIRAGTDFLSAPFIYFLAESMKQPVVQELVKEGVILSERLQESWAETEEIFEDLVERARSELGERRQQELRVPVQATWGNTRDSKVAIGIEDLLLILNQQVGVMTQGLVDLRLLLPLGLGTLALRQLLLKGFQVEEIPWYALAWYAFDSFVKLNHSEDLLNNPPDE